MTAFGNTRIYNLYVVFYAGSYYFIIFFGLIVLNGLIIKKYREYSKIRSKMNKTKIKRLSREEKTFSLTIIITTSTFIITLIFNLIGVTLVRVYFIYGRLYDPTVNIFRAVGYFFISLNYAIDPFVYLSIDHNLKKIIVRYIMSEHNRE